MVCRDCLSTHVPYTLLFATGISGEGSNALVLLLLKGEVIIIHCTYTYTRTFVVIRALLLIW